VLFADGTAPESFVLSVGPAAPVAFSAADGSFTAAAPGGTHDVVVTGPSFERALVADVAVPEGGEKDLGTIEVGRGRSVSGRVVDPTGAPASGARVAGGLLLTGNGSELNIVDEGFLVQETTADDDGRFVLRGFGEHPITIVAQKDGASGTMRASSVRIPRGPQSVELELALLATGSLAGTVTRDGRPAGDTVVIANPRGATSSNFFVVTGADGKFAFETLTAGEYLVYPMFGGGGGRPKDMFMRVAKVVAGERAQTEIAARSGPVTLSIRPLSAAGEPIAAAQVFLLNTAVDGPTMEALRDATWLDPTRLVAFYLRMAMGAPARVEGLVPGPHTACAVPLPVDPNDPSSMQRAMGMVESLPMRCQPVTVGAAPAEQTIELRMLR
jgi:hypothetical protein